MLAACIASGFCAAAAPSLDKESVQLSTRDRELVTEAACRSIGAAGADKLEAFTRGRGAATIHATVQCKPHRQEESLPLAHYTTCSNGTGVWRCEDGHDAVQMRMRDSSVVAVRAGDVGFATAIELIGEAEKLVYPPFHTPALTLTRGTCTVARKPDIYSAEFQRYGVDCDAGSFDISKVCPGKKCGYFITQGARKD